MEKISVVSQKKSLDQLPEQLDKSSKERLTKQQYRVVGSHSAVKTCGWTKNMLRGQGGCYKLKFYGIMSNQCMQMTPSVSCANRCVFCWRDYKAPVSKEWKWKTDEPEKILEGSIEAHHKLLEGFNHGKNTNQAAYNKSKEVKHVALSLTGEPIAYPRINALLKLFNKKGISTFLVTNAQFPEQIRDLEPVTQLYLSLDAPSEVLLKKVDIPLFNDFWSRLNKSLDYLSQKKHRTCIRLTLVKNVNMQDLKGYSYLIHKGNPDFIEIKAYMFVGASQQRLKFENMPNSEEVMSFAKQLLPFIPEYDLVSEHYPSRVVMLAKKKFYFADSKGRERWHTWIDFPKYNELVNAGDSEDSVPETMSYLKPTPGTLIVEKDKEVKLDNSKGIKVDEQTDEMEFWSPEQDKKKDDKGGC